MPVKTEPSRRRSVHGAAAALAALALLGGAPLSCSKQSASSEAPMADEAAPSGASMKGAGDPLAELDDLELQMRGLGLEPSNRRFAEAPPADLDVSVTEGDGAAAGELGGDAAGDAKAPTAANSTQPAPPPDPDNYADVADEAPMIEAEAQPEPAEESRAAGRDTRGDKQQARLSKKAERDRCDAVCGLSEAICELEIRICEMSEEHEGEATYANACERAIDDCEVAGIACDHCG